MANEKKTETPKTEPKPDMAKNFSTGEMVELAPVPTEQEGIMHLERIAVALERLADAFAPVRVGGAHGRPLAKRCEKGHGMQATDDYCQTCHAEMKGGTKMREVTLDELRGTTQPGIE